MKKRFSLVLIIALLLSMCACRESEEEKSFSRPIGEGSSTQGESDYNIWDLLEEEGLDPETPEVGELKDQSPSVTDKTDSPEGSGIAITPETADQVPRLDLIPCRAKAEIRWGAVRFYQEKTGLYLRFLLPEDWSLEPLSDGSYELWRAGEPIGWVTGEPLEETKRYMETVEVTWQDDRTIFADISVAWNDRANLKEVYRDIKIHGEEGGEAFALNIHVLYGELDDAAEETIFAGIQKTKEKTDLPIEPIAGGNASKKILILGDEAIASSRIADFLQDLLAGSGYTAEMAAMEEAGIKNVSFDTDLCQRLANGEYCYLFLAGLYDDVDISTLATTLALCNRSETKVALFPALGENRLAIDAAKKVYEDVRFLDWKAELEELIGRGVAESQFQTENTKSTLLAGYVGAHMIYRNLFRETPPALQNAPLSMAEITAALNDYPQTDHTADILAEYTF